MKLQQLRVTQFRQFTDSVQVTDLSPGLNLFSGPNESGKSTLVHAIRVAFFERHNATTLVDLQPWGDTSAAPEVELIFSHKGQQWHLNKRFLQRRRCDLEVDGVRHTGAEAEELLASFLGYSVSSRGASKAEHWGVPGLLWIEQGLGQELQEPVTHAGEQLKSVLGDSLGEMTSSDGDQAMREVQKRLDELHTSTGKPRGDYKRSVERVIELDEQLLTLDQRISSYQQQVDRLGELRQRQMADEAARPWDELRAQQQAAEVRFREVEQLEETQHRELKTLEQTLGSRELVLEQLRHFTNERSDLERRQASCKQIQNVLAELESQQAELINQRDAAVVAYQQVQQQERLVRQVARRHELEREYDQLAQRCRQLQDTIGQTQLLQRELLEQEQALAQISVTQDTLSRLETQHRSLRELDIRRESIATRLQFELLPGQAVELNGKQLSGSGEELLLQQAQLVLADLGVLTITPGGQDLAELARQYERLAEQYHQLLAELHVESLVSAQESFKQQQSLQAGIQVNIKLLRSQAPDGVAALEQQLVLSQSRQRELTTQLQTLPEITANSVGVELNPEAAERKLDQASEQLGRAEQASAALKEQLIQQRQALLHAEQECQQLQQRLSDPDRNYREQQLNDQLLMLQAQEQHLKRQTVERAAAIAQARPDIIEQDIRRFRDSAVQLEQAFAQRKEELIALQAGLQSEAAAGLEETRATCAAEREAEARRSGEYARRAGALTLLNDLLSKQRQRVTRQLQAPLQKRLNHYLQLLFPQASIEVDEDLVPRRLIRPGQNTGEFDALSFGAREQMGLLSRLAYADLLREAGRPTLIILDDALVHSDQPRLEQMKRILFDAAQRHQVLLFSCHPDRWLDLGVPVREMSQLKAPTES